MHTAISGTRTLPVYEPILVFLPRENKRELFKDYKLILKLIAQN